MNSDISILRAFVASTEPEHVAVFDLAIRQASEVIAIGSGADGSIGPYSDLDLIFIGDGKRLKTRRLDFMWVRPKQLSAQSWLGSELANHAARYGKWLKGDGKWRSEVFIGDFSVSNKCERILIRISRVYLKRRLLREETMAELLAPAVLDMQRAVILAQGEATPPTAIVARRLLQNPDATLERICGDDLLGDFGRYLIRDFLPMQKILARIERSRRDPI
ncbi:MAG: hypothetical protein JWM32_912 [Verrucomicrobia bacterium]|nr:hypothetical protein [Verrucomicrobiota bacterium]